MNRYIPLLFLLLSCTNIQITQDDKKLQKEAKSYFKPLERPTSISSDKITLGKKLYFETSLSLNNKISCNSCHNLDTFGVDNQKTSPGHDGRRGTRNSPTTLNSHLNFKQFWDGRAKDLSEQAVGHILNPIEHGIPNEKEALTKINTPEYLAMFKKAFPKEKKPFNFKNIGVAIESFERTLVTPSRFDDYLKGDIQALSSKERLGLKSFIQIGCTSCHAGEGLTSNSFQKLGIVKPYKSKDLGRFEVTNRKRDEFKFKVPILRNIEKTGPYFHDGSIKTLEQAIKIMAEYQLGKQLTDEEVSNIKAFLSSLTAKTKLKI